MARRTRSRSFAPDRLVHEWDSADYHDPRFMEALLQHKEQILPAIRNTAMLGHGRLGFNGCVILLFLGEIEGAKHLLDRLRGDDRETRQQAMMRLAYLPFHSERGGYQLPIDKKTVFAAVAPRSIHPSHKFIVWPRRCWSDWARPRRMQLFGSCSTIATRRPG